MLQGPRLWFQGLLTAFSLVATSSHMRGQWPTTSSEPTSDVSMASNVEHLSELNFEYAMNEEDFGARHLLSMVTDPAAFATTGWTYDRMLHQELEPAPTVQHCSCEETPGGLPWPCPRGELPCPMGADGLRLSSPRERLDSRGRRGRRQERAASSRPILVHGTALHHARVPRHYLLSRAHPYKLNHVPELRSRLRSWWRSPTAASVGSQRQTTQLPYELVTVSATEGAPQARARE